MRHSLTRLETRFVMHVEDIASRTADSIRIAT
jgi:hypothetical protein